MDSVKTIASLPVEILHGILEYVVWYSPVPHFLSLRLVDRRFDLLVQKLLFDELYFLSILTLHPETTYNLGVSTTSRKDTLFKPVISRTWKAFLTIPISNIPPSRQASSLALRDVAEKLQDSCGNFKRNKDDNYLDRAISDLGATAIALFGPIGTLDSLYLNDLHDISRFLDDIALIGVYVTPNRWRPLVAATRGQPEIIDYSLSQLWRHDPGMGPVDWRFHLEVWEQFVRPTSQNIQVWTITLFATLKVAISTKQFDVVKHLLDRYQKYICTCLFAKLRSHEGGLIEVAVKNFQSNILSLLLDRGWKFYSYNNTWRHIEFTMIGVVIKTLELDVEHHLRLRIVRVLLEHHNGWKAAETRLSLVRIAMSRADTEFLRLLIDLSEPLPQNQTPIKHEFASCSPENPTPDFLHLLFTHREHLLAPAVSGERITDVLICSVLKSDPLIIDGTSSVLLEEMIPHASQDFLANSLAVVASQCNEPILRLCVDKNLGNNNREWADYLFINWTPIMELKLSKGQIELTRALQRAHIQNLTTLMAKYDVTLGPEVADWRAISTSSPSKICEDLMTISSLLRAHGCSTKFDQKR